MSVYFGLVKDFSRIFFLRQADISAFPLIFQEKKFLCPSALLSGTCPVLCAGEDGSPHAAFFW